MKLKFIHQLRRLPEHKLWVSIKSGTVLIKAQTDGLVDRSNQILENMTCKFE